LDPSDARFHVEQARAYESAHQNDQALAAAEKAVTLDPTKIPYYLEYAQLLMDMGQDDRARQALAIALLRDAHNANAHLLLGVLWAQNNRVADARREFEQAVRDDPANLEAQDSLARLVAILPDATPAQLGDALARAQNAVAASQRANPAYLDTLAMVWHRMGNDRQALAALTEALNVKVPIDATVRGNIQRHMAAYGPRDTAPATTR